MIGDAAKRRFNKFVSNFGESILINAADPAKAFFHIMRTGQLHSFYIDSEAASVARPAFLMYVSGDTAIYPSDTVAHDGRTLFIRKVFNYRIGSVIVYKVASMD